MNLHEHRDIDCLEEADLIKPLHEIEREVQEDESDEEDSLLEVDGCRWKTASR